MRYLILLVLLAGCGKEGQQSGYVGPEAYGVPKVCADWMKDWSASPTPPQGCEKYKWPH